MVRALLDEIEPLVLTMPEMLTESGFVSTYTCDKDTLLWLPLQLLQPNQTT